jgi:hypothetical protein
MANIGGINIADKNSDFTSGAAFLLSKKSRVSESVQIGDNAVVHVQPASNYAVVRFKNATSNDEALSMGQEFIQQGLDLLSISGKDDLTLRDATDEYITSWKENNTQVLRITSTTTLNFDVPPVRVTVHDKDGNEILSPIIEPKYNYAFRFFRLSQITDDIYDAYRNMYLAFELLLSSQYPIEKNEREINWLRRGISNANISLNFKALLPTSTNDPIQEIIQTIYDKARLPLFHAKEGRGFYPPQSSEYRNVIIKALDLLTKMVLKMSEAWYDARRLGGGVFHGWVYESMKQILSTAKMLVSDDSSQFDKSQKDLTDNRYKSALWLQTELIRDDSERKGPSLLGKLEINDSTFKKTFWRIEIVDDKHPIIGLLLENELFVSDIDRLECHIHTRVGNVRQPKKFFPR